MRALNELSASSTTSATTPASGVVAAGGVPSLVMLARETVGDGALQVCRAARRRPLVALTRSLVRVLEKAVVKLIKSMPARVRQHVDCLVSKQFVSMAAASSFSSLAANRAADV